MEKALQPIQTEAPLPYMAVVDSPRPEMGLICLEKVEDYPRGTVLKCYGAYGSIRYVRGPMPKDLRDAAIKEDYCNEVIYGDVLPLHLAEMDVDEYPPGTFAMIILDAKIVPKPEVEEAKEPQCKVIKHWASYGVQPKARKPKPDNGQLAIFPFADFNEPSNKQTA